MSVVSKQLRKTTRALIQSIMNDTGRAYQDLVKIAIEDGEIPDASWQLDLNSMAWTKEQPDAVGEDGSAGGGGAAGGATPVASGDGPPDADRTLRLEPGS